MIVLQVVHISGPGASAEPDSSIRAIWNRKALAGSTIEAVLAGYRAYDSAARRVAARYSATYVKTEAFGLRGSEYFADAIHFNDSGADLMARSFADALIVMDEFKRLLPQEPRDASRHLVSVGN